MKVSLSIMSLLMFFSFNASAGAFPNVQVDHNSSMVIKISSALEQCIAKGDRELGCTEKLRRCFLEGFGIRENWSLEQIESQVSARHYKDMTIECKKRTGFDRCQDKVRFEKCS